MEKLKINLECDGIQINKTFFIDNEKRTLEQIIVFDFFHKLSEYLKNKYIIYYIQPKINIDFRKIDIYYCKETHDPDFLLPKFLLKSKAKNICKKFTITFGDTLKDEVKLHSNSEIAYDV